MKREKLRRTIRFCVRYLWLWLLLQFLFGIAFFAFSGDFSVLPAIYRAPGG